MNPRLLINLMCYAVWITSIALIAIAQKTGSPELLGMGKALAVIVPALGGLGLFLHRRLDRIAVNRPFIGIFVLILCGGVIYATLVFLASGEIVGIILISVMFMLPSAAVLPFVHDLWKRDRARTKNSR